MNKKLVALMLLLAILLITPICMAQPDDDDQEQVWLPPSWVFGSGYSPYDYPSSVWGWYDPFAYYSRQGKTYHPYIYSYYYYPYSTYPYYYQYNYYPYTYNWYPYTYHGGYWWS